MELRGDQRMCIEYFLDLFELYAKPFFRLLFCLFTVLTGFHKADGLVMGKIHADTHPLLHRFL